MSYHPNSDPGANRRRRWRIAALITVPLLAAVILLDLASGVVLGVHLNGVVAGPSVRDTAEQLKTHPHWELVEEEATDHPDGWLILACPEIRKRWNIGYQKMSCSELQQLLRDSGYNVITHRNSYIPEANESLKTCGAGEIRGLTAEATAKSGRLHVSASVSPGKSVLDGYTFSLRMAK